MKDLGLSAGRPVWFCVSMSHTVNGELGRAEPSYLDTSSWRRWEGAGSRCGQRRWQHPVAEGLAKPPLPCPGPAPASPLSPTSSGQRALLGGILQPFDGTLLLLGGSFTALWGCPSRLPTLTPEECPTSITHCRSSTDFPRQLAPEGKKKNQSCLRWPPSFPCLPIPAWKTQPTSCSSGCIISSSP